MDAPLSVHILLIEPKLSLTSREIDPVGKMTNFFWISSISNNSSGSAGSSHNHVESLCEKGDGVEIAHLDEQLEHFGKEGSGGTDAALHSIAGGLQVGPSHFLHFFSLVVQGKCVLITTLQLPSAKIYHHYKYFARCDRIYLSVPSPNHFDTFF